MAVLGLVFPTPELAAGQRPPAEQPEKLPPAGTVVDVCLSAGGRLDGRVVNHAGHSQPGVSVTVYRAGRIIATEVTGRDGAFSVSALPGGVHALGVPGAHRIARLWAPGTAPPCAVARLMLVDSSGTVRGQRQPGPLGQGYEKLKYWLTDPLVVAGIITVAVAVPVAVHNANQDRDSGS